jgi:hypothetical protein
MSVMSEVNEQQRMQVTQGVMNMLDAWNLSARDIIKILDLPGTVRSRNVARFREDTPFPDEPEVLKRVDYLLRISDALRTYFPRNPEMRSLWMRKANRHFGRKAPLATMVEGGESGLISVLMHLDCTYAWDRTGSKASYGS